MSDDVLWQKIGLLGEALGVSPDAMRKWRERDGVPGKWHLPLLRAAREQNVSLTDDELLSTTNRTTAA